MGKGRIPGGEVEGVTRGLGTSCYPLKPAPHNGVLTHIPYADYRKGNRAVKYLTLAARLLIGGLFVYASVYKILDPLEFSAAIRNYLLLPPAWSNLVALTLPWVEITAGALLIPGLQTKPASLLTTLMLLCFFVAVFYAYWTGLDIDCGCFGSPAASGGRVGVYHLLRDAGLLGASLFIVVCDRGDFALESFLAVGNRASRASAA